MNSIYMIILGRTGNLVLTLAAGTKTFSLTLSGSVSLNIPGAEQLNAAGNTLDFQIRSWVPRRRGRYSLQYTMNQGSPAITAVQSDGAECSSAEPPKPTVPGGAVDCADHVTKTQAGYGQINYKLNVPKQGRSAKMNIFYSSKVASLTSPQGNVQAKAGSMRKIFDLSPHRHVLRGRQNQVLNIDLYGHYDQVNDQQPEIRAITYGNFKCIIGNPPTPPTEQPTSTLGGGTCDAFNNVLQEWTAGGRGELKIPVAQLLDTWTVEVRYVLKTVLTVNGRKSKDKLD